MKEQKLVKLLKEQGYDLIYIWDAEPNESDPDHTHDFDTKLVVLTGEIKIGMKNVEKILKSGEETQIPKNTVHFGLAGAKGCKYIVAEKH